MAGLDKLPHLQVGISRVEEDVVSLQEGEEDLASGPILVVQKF